MIRRQLIHFLFALCLSISTSIGRADSGEPLIFGVFPYVTAKEIIETYRPLAASLEKQLRRKVLLYTARDFKTFAERTREGEYDLLLTAPHLAWLASEETGYLPLLEHARPVFGLVVVRDDAPLDSLASLRGQTIATASPLALVVLAAQADLAAQGLKAQTDYTASNAVTHVNAAMQVVNGRAGAAILAQQPYLTMRPEFRAQLRTLYRTAPLPGLVYLTHPRLGVNDVDAVRAALQRFAHSSAGRKFLQRGNHGSLNPVSLKDLATMQPLAQQAQTLLGKAR